MNSSGLFLLKVVTYDRGCSLFLSTLILCGVFFLLITTLYLLVLLKILSGIWLCVILYGEFFKVFFGDYYVYSTC